MNSTSENVYIDKLDDIVNKYNNKYHKTIKIKPVDVKSNAYNNSGKKVKLKILNLQLAMLLEYQNMKIFLQKAMFQNDLKNSSWLRKLKILCFGQEKAISYMLNEKAIIVALKIGLIKNT